MDTQIIHERKWVQLVVQNLGWIAALPFAIQMNAWKAGYIGLFANVFVDLTRDGIKINRFGAHFFCYRVHLSGKLDIVIAKMLTMWTPRSVIFHDAVTIGLYQKCGLGFSGFVFRLVLNQKCQIRLFLWSSVCTGPFIKICICWVLRGMTTKPFCRS